MKKILFYIILILFLSFFLWQECSYSQTNLLPDSLIKQIQPINQFGVPFVRWSGWIWPAEYGGTDAELKVSKNARIGKTCAEMLNAGSKVSLYIPPVKLIPGKYIFSCYIQGFEIQPGAWGLTVYLNFIDNKFYNLKINGQNLTGNFGWRKISIVKEVKKTGIYYGRIYIAGPGRLWVDNGAIYKVPENTLVTSKMNPPTVGNIEQPLKPPAPLPHWKQKGLPKKRLLASFEDGTIKPFFNGEVTTKWASQGKYSLLLKSGEWVNWFGSQNWSGYDFFKMDVNNENKNPTSFYLGINDTGTRGYWTRVNYYTELLPGVSTIILPLRTLYVGEKDRPGRLLYIKHIVQLFFIVNKASKPVMVDNLRLTMDESGNKIKVPGLLAFSFGPGFYSDMPGFINVSPLTIYDPAYGAWYGLKNASIWRPMNFNQPDPLYGRGIYIENGGFAVNLPNGEYHVFVNIDAPGGFWGGYQIYRKREIIANGKIVLDEKMNFNEFLKKYFRYANHDDTVEENVFDKYQIPYFNEKQFNVNVTNGQLYLQFLQFGESWRANDVSCLVIYPVKYAKLGQKWLKNLQKRREFYFNTYFKEIPPNPYGDAKGIVPLFVPTPKEQAKGYVVFSRNWMEDTYCNSVPRRQEVCSNIKVVSSAGEHEPIVFSIYPLKNVGRCTVFISNLVSANGDIISKKDINVGLVSHRVVRVTSDGSIYTIAPKFVRPVDSAQIEKGITTTFWSTLKVPDPVKAGVYKGKILLVFNNGKVDIINLTARIFSTPLDKLDVPAGPFGCEMPMPWFNTPRVADYEWTMYKKDLKELRAYGFTCFSGIPSLSITGWNNGKPVIKGFKLADKEMAYAKKLGFELVSNYGGGFIGDDIQNYQNLRMILSEINQHAQEKGWLPLVINLFDEPEQSSMPQCTENDLYWKKILQGLNMLQTTGATSLTSAQIKNSVMIALDTSVDVVMLNLHDATAINTLKKHGENWAFYNDGNRWTFGINMFKAVTKYGMKFRLSYNWNAAAGDPYYALDCREDDYAWCVTNADEQIIPTIEFLRIAAGVEDYRYLETLSRLIKKNPNNPAVAEAQKFINQTLSSCHIEDKTYTGPLNYFQEFRLKAAEEIGKFSK